MVLLVVGDNSTSYAETSENTYDKNHEVGFYGCEKSSNLKVRCNPLNNKTESYEIEGNSSKIYDITREPTFVDSIRGKALQMHASYLESVEFPNNPVFNPKEFSVSFWIKKVPEEENSYGHVLSHSNVHIKQGWHFDVSKMINASSEAVSFVLYNNSGHLYTSTQVPISTNTFTHIVGTVNGSAIKIFKDGILQGESEFNGNHTDPEVPLKIGAGAYCVTCNMWGGIIDDLQYYNKSLVENEVKNIFYNKTSGINLTGSLIGHWTFDGTLNDISGYKNEGTPNTLLGSLVFTPDGRLLFTEKNTGKVRIMKDNEVLENHLQRFLTLTSTGNRVCWD